MTVQAFSEGLDLPASFAWIAAALRSRIRRAQARTDALRATGRMTTAARSRRTSGRSRRIRRASSFRPCSTRARSVRTRCGRRSTGAAAPRRFGRRAASPRLNPGRRSVTAAKAVVGAPPWVVMLLDCLGYTASHTRNTSTHRGLTCQWSATAPRSSPRSCFSWRAVRASRHRSARSSEPRSRLRYPTGTARFAPRRPRPSARDVRELPRRLRRTPRRACVQARSTRSHGRREP